MRLSLCLSHHHSHLPNSLATPTLSTSTLVQRSSPLPALAPPLTPLSSPFPHLPNLPHLLHFGVLRYAEAMTASFKKLSAGDGLTYYTRQTAVQDATDRGRAGLTDYYSEKGEKPGKWLGRGVQGLESIAAGDTVSEAQMIALWGEGRHPDADVRQASLLAGGATAKEALAATKLGQQYPKYAEETRPYVVEVASRIREWNLSHGAARDAVVPAAVRAEIRTDVGRESFVKRYEREPDERELAGHIARESRPSPRACAGFDITFTPVKSVSVLWGLGNRAVVDAVEEAHAAAVQHAISWMEDNALFTRRGSRGARQVQTRGAIAAAFNHRDSRDGDPNLHTHVVIANKVQDANDGTWLAVDGDALYKAVVCISERYNTALELELNRRLGVTFHDQERDNGKRATREITGISDAALAAASHRRQAIDARREHLTSIFARRHGRPPSPVEAIKIAQQANLETRADKHEPRSFSEQRESWRSMIGGAIGGEAGIQSMLRDVRSQCSARGDDWTQVDVDTLAERATSALESARARFQNNHIQAEVDRRVRAANLTDAASERLREELTQAVVARCIRIDPITAPQPPRTLQRSDGRSVYDRAWSEMFTTADIIQAEQTVISAARQQDGRRSDPQAVGTFIHEAEQRENARKLNPAQVALVTDMLTSGRRAQLALAPAGSGKTTAMKVLADAWQADGGTVLGLAPSAVAAEQLSAAFGDSHVDTLAKLTWELTEHPDSYARPEWVNSVDERTLVVVDEAGMTSTRDIAAVVEFALARGASVRLVGDDQQLAAVEAGGVLRDLKTEIGAVTLTELMRFRNAEESAATLALRDGDTEAVGFYIDNARLHLHDEATIAEAVYQAWERDVAAGRTSLMLAYSHAVADELNLRARESRVSAGIVHGPHTSIRGGLHIAAGDTIVTRRNNRNLAISRTDWVKNGDMWEVLQVHGNGAVQARHLASGRAIWLPAEYVANSVDLGYARTVHTAQGVTVDTCHVALNGQETRQLAYTAATRGAIENHLYVFAGGAGDPADANSPTTIRPQTAGEILAGVIARDGAQTSARTARREATDPARILADLTTQWNDSVGVAALSHLQPGKAEQILSAAESILPGLTSAPAWDTLLAHLAQLELSNVDAIETLHAAIGQRELGTAIDPAAVLDWRIDPTGKHSAGRGPLPWLTSVPQAVSADPEWASYLATLSQQIAASADAVSQTMTTMPTEDLPRWAVDLADDRQLLARVAVWRAASGIPDADVEVLGTPPAPNVAAKQYSEALATRIALVAGPRAKAETPAWARRVADSHPDLQNDLYWPVVVSRLQQAATAGLDPEALILAALSRGPLPDEHPASALWYRLATTVSPVAAVAGDTVTNRLRPPWTDQMCAALGERAAARVLRDPQWPSLVAAVTQAERSGQAAVDIITSAVQSVHPDTLDQPGGISLQDLTVVLTWRITAGPSDHDNDAPPPPDPDSYDPDIEAYLDSERPDLGRRVPTEPEPPAPGWDREPDESGPAEPEARHTRQTEYGPTPVARIIELNEAAAAFWAEQYAQPDNPAARYMTARFGDDLSADQRITIGSAPDQWTALTDHLRAAGATDTELLDASLASTKNGRVYDFFVNRVVLGLRDTQGRLVGFTGRALPSDKPTRSTPAKYMNSRNTAAFNKGTTIFGLTENADRLAAGATPVLTEGAMDALAVTLATNGSAIGLAPSGTALTQAQADLIAHAAGEREGLGGVNVTGLVVVATDDDKAGRAAAKKDFWMLQAAGADCKTLPLPSDGSGKQDPAGSYQLDGGEHLRRVLTYPDLLQSLAWKLIDEQAEVIATADHPVARVAALRQCGAILATTSPEGWADDIHALVDRLSTDAWDQQTYREIVTEATIREAVNWQLDVDETPLTQAEQAHGRILALHGRMTRDGSESLAVPPVAEELADRIRELRSAAEHRPDATPTQAEDQEQHQPSPEQDLASDQPTRSDPTR